MKTVSNHALLLSIIFFSFFSCTDKKDTNERNTNIEYAQYSLINSINWLLGEWNNVSPEGTASEIWGKLNDSTFIGESYFIIENDTVSSETIRINQLGEELFYVPTVNNQNDNLPVQFTFTSYTNGKVIFENAKHDFPQKICYSKITSDSLLVEISGTVDGKLNSMTFPITRKKQCQ